MGKVHYCRDHAGACGYWHSYEIFFAWATGVGWLRIDGNIETGKTTGTGYHKKKAGDCTQARQQARHVSSGNFCRNLVKSPGPREQSGSDAESNDVRQ